MAVSVAKKKSQRFGHMNVRTFGTGDTNVATRVSRTRMVLDLNKSRNRVNFTFL